MRTQQGGSVVTLKASKLMDQLKVFVGMAIFLSQMVPSPGIASVSNTTQISISPGGKWTHSLFIPTVQRKLMEGKRAAVTEHVISYILFIPRCSFNLVHAVNM